MNKSPSILGPALWLGVLFGLARAEASVTNLPHVVQLAPGQTLRQMADKALGQAEAADELLHFNRLTKPGGPEGARELIVPGEARTLALAALAGAEEKVVAAALAQAPKFAAGIYDQAVRSREQARQARLEAKYDQAVMLARVAAVQADEAARQARNNAVVDDPATVVVISGPGKVELSDAGVDNWVVAKVGDPMRPGMRLRTAADTRAEVRLTDGSSLQVTPGTEMELPENTVDRRDNTQRTTRIKVLLGDILGEIKPRRDAANPTNSTFRIQAGKTAISIRGTTLLVGANQASETRVSMHEGLADVSKAEVSKELKENFGLLVKPNEKMRDPENLPLPPTLVWPKEKDEVTKLQKPEIQWGEPAAKTASVRVQVSRDERFNDIVHDAVVVTKEAGASVVARVLPAGKYFARVSALTRSALEGAPTAALAFEVRPDLGLRFRPNPSASFDKEKGMYFTRDEFTATVDVAPGNTHRALLEMEQAGAWVNISTQAVRNAKGGFLDGRYRMKAKAVGPDNQEGPEETLVFVVDTNPPRLSMQTAQPEAGGAGRDSTLVTVTASDENGVGTVEYRLNQGEWRPYTEPVRVTHLDDTRFQIRATDRLGNLSAPVTLELSGSRVRR